MIKKNVLFIILLVSTQFLFSQTDEHTCFKNKTKHTKKRSASLSLNDIVKTEKYDVSYYKLLLDVTNMNTSIAGKVDMHLIVREKLDTILYELFPTFKINCILVNGDTMQFFRGGESAILIPFTAVKGEHIKVQTVYNGFAPTESTNPLGGSGYSNAFSKSWKKNVSWTLSEPFSAYEWFPCKQSLTDKIDSVDVSIVVPDSCMAGSNGLLQQIVLQEDGKKRFEWKHRYPIDYYLISFSVADYEDYQFYAHPKNTTDSILVQNYLYRNPDVLPYFKSEIDYTATYLNYFSEIFTLYPFYKEKYGHCMAPINGGMEHQTMTTLGFFNRRLVAHELAHQWWGDNVTCASWSDIWLNEGFASYSEYLMNEKLEQGSGQALLKAIHNDVLKQIGGSVWVKDSLNEDRVFSGRFSYNKGSSIIHILRYIINNDSLFFGGLRAFQTTYSGKTARAVDFKNTMELFTKMSLSAFFNEWYYGEGYPIYEVDLNAQNDELKLRISHQGSASTTLFTNPIDVNFSRANNLPDTIIRFPISSQEVIFTFPTSSALKGVVSLNPTNQILCKSSITSSITDLPQSLFQIYPNPSNDHAMISLSNRMSMQGVYQLQMMDVCGKVVFSERVVGDKKLDLGSFSKGIYLISVENGSSKEIVKMIIE